MDKFSLDIEQVTQELSTILDFIRWSVTHFNQADLSYGHGTDNAWDEAVHLVLSTLNLSPDSDVTVLEAKLTREEKQAIALNVEKRVKDRIPVPYLINEAWFAGLNFYVDERSIIPRSPIAELIEEQFSPWVDVDNVENILDLCTGSGCIAIGCAFNFPHALVDAVELNEKTMEVAQINVDRFEIDDQVKLIQGDLFENVSDKQYDIIVSNPPYVASREYEALPEEYTHEPKMALEAADDGLAIVSEILKKAHQYLTPKGVLVVEVGLLQDLVERTYPDVPFTWLQFERGGEGVFLLTADELREFSDHISKGA